MAKSSSGTVAVGLQGAIPQIITFTCDFHYLRKVLLWLLTSYFKSRSLHLILLVLFLSLPSPRLTKLLFIKLVKL